MPTAGQIIVSILVANGVDRVFCVPGESYLGLLDAVCDRPSVDTVVCRHEAGAGFMALADARLTGRVGVACVSRGPGASNAAFAPTAEEIAQARRVVELFATNAGAGSVALDGRMLDAPHLLHARRILATATVATSPVREWGASGSRPVRPGSRPGRDPSPDR